MGSTEVEAVVPSDNNGPTTNTSLACVTGRLLRSIKDRSDFLQDARVKPAAATNQVHADPVTPQEGNLDVVSGLNQTNAANLNEIPAAQVAPPMANY